MKIDDRIIAELNRYNNINKYISEQDIPGEVPDDLPPVDAGVPPADPGAIAPPAAPTDDTTPVDTESDPDVEKIDDSGKSEEKKEESGSEELDITDLVNVQKNIETKQEEYFQNLFSHLENLGIVINEDFVDRNVDVCISKGKIKIYAVESDEQEMMFKLSKRF